MGQQDSDFEDLEIYRRARSLRKKFYNPARRLPEEEKFLLRPQIFDAARSLTNNLRKSQRRGENSKGARTVREVEKAI